MLAAGSVLHDLRNARVIRKLLFFLKRSPSAKLWLYWYRSTDCLHKIVEQNRRMLIPLIWVVLLLVASAATAQPAAVAERYGSMPASADGIGKRYMGREISAVMGWKGAAWLEREERDREERTDLLLAALALRPGMVVADIGAGTGYLSRRMAPAVMPGGKIWAVDVRPEMISLLQAGAKRSGLTQIEARLGTVDDVKLPAGSVDLAVMVDVHHELAYPYEVMASLMKALKPGGRVVFVEY